MKEEIYMNPRMIDVVLVEAEKEKDILRFNVSEDEVIDVNLNESSCQKSLKELFSALLERSIEEETVLNFQVSEGYDRIMYVEVCKEYIEDINRELKEAANKIRLELSN